MISELKKENIDKITNTFIDKEYLENEFNNNPFAKVLILEEDNKVIGYLYYSDIYDRVEINQFEIEESTTLEVREDNIFAIKLYEKNGFIKKAKREGYYNGIDGILMERKDSSK